MTFLKVLLLNLLKLKPKVNNATRATDYANISTVFET